MILSDYPVTFREGQVDVLVCRDMWPWPREEEQVSLLPDRGTQGEAELRGFIERHGMVPDLHPLPHVGIRSEDRFDHTYWFPDEGGVRVLKPWAGVYHRQLIIEFYENDPAGLDVFDRAKFVRWKGFVESVKDHARLINDEITERMCLQVLPVIDRAMAHFDQSQQKNQTGILQGRGVQPGIVRGIVQLWQEGADFCGKIAVLTHAMPLHVTHLREAIGLVTDQGGTLSHAAVIAREFGIPTVIGTQTATRVLKNGDLIELDGSLGMVRHIIK